MLCTAQLGGPILKAFGITGINPEAVWWEQGLVFMSSWPSDITGLCIDRRRTARFKETEPDNSTSKTQSQALESDHCRELKASGPPTG